MKQIFDEMHRQFKLRIKPPEKDYSKLPITDCCRAWFIEDTDVCSVCGRRSLAVCKVCDGCGTVVQTKRINAITINVPYINCPECHGSGKVDVEHSYLYL